MTPCNRLIFLVVIFMLQHGTHCAFKKKKKAKPFLFIRADIFFNKHSYLSYIDLLLIDFQCIEKDLLFFRTL
jgi:hypothetical protein